MAAFWLKFSLAAQNQGTRYIVISLDWFPRVEYNKIKMSYSDKRYSLYGQVKFAIKQVKSVDKGLATFSVNVFSSWNPNILLTYCISSHSHGGLHLSILFFND